MESIPFCFRHSHLLGAFLLFLCHLLPTYVKPEAGASDQTAIDLAPRMGCFDLFSAQISSAGAGTGVLVTKHVVSINTEAAFAASVPCTHLRVEKIRGKRWFILICSKWQRLVSSQYNRTVHQAHLSTTKYCCKHEQHASLAYYICIMQIEEHIQDKI